MGRKNMKTDKKKETKKNEDSELNDISYLGLYRYAKWYEALASALGVMLGLFSATGMCYNIVQFGEMSTAFVDRTARTDELTSYLPLLQTFGGGERIANGSKEANMAALVRDAGALAAGMCTSIVLSLLLSVLSVTLVNWSALRQVTRIRSLFLKAVLRQNQAWYDTDTSFNLASRMSDDMLKLKDGLGEKVAIVANLVGTAVLSVCFCFPLGWELTLACLTVVPFSLASSYALSKYQIRSSIQEMESYSQAGKQAEEVIKNIRTVVAYAGEQREVDKYRKLLVPAERCGRRRGLFTGLGTGFNWVLTYSLNAIGLAYGTRLVVSDLAVPVDQRSYEVGEIFSILFSVYMATQSITFCVPHGEAFSSARAAAAGIFKLLDRQPEIDSMSEDGASPRRVRGEITIENVVFSYPARPDVQVLNGFSLHIRAGESVALVGSSGCGKSTILQLVQRMYDPHSGTVKVDGHDIKKLNIGWLRSILGVVGQEPVLFRGTVFENIAIGQPDATLEEVQDAAKLANAHDFITSLPNGYNTVIAERGGSLSGGQKQRVAIARSLLRAPAVLLLDEATSALDPASERQVQTALDRVAKGLTTLTVSHRLSTIIKADRIICMDQGVIVEEGTHEELLKKCGFYFKLVSAGNELKDPDKVEVLNNVDELEEDGDNLALQPRADVKRRSRRTTRRHSCRESRDWLTPRASITSAMSVGLKNFHYNCDSDDEADNQDGDENLKPVSDWQLLKLNSPEWPLMVVGSIAAMVQGSCFPIFAFLYSIVAGMFSNPNNEEILRDSVLYSGMFMAVAAIAGVSMCVQSVAFTNSGLRMTTRLRQQYFGSLLKQDMSYYDRECNTVGAICSRLSTDSAEVQGATGLRVGLVLQGFTSVLVGFVLAVTYSWKLALVATSFLPLMVGSIWLEGIVSQKSQVDERAAMETATSIATEAVVSIRTVQSLGIEKSFLERFETTLESAAIAVAKKTKWRGLVLGLGTNVPMLAYCSATAYGAYLVATEDMAYQITILVNEAIMYGSYMLGQSLVYAPNFNAAKMCGARILATVQRVPRVATERHVKDNPDWICRGSVSLKKVEFSYLPRGGEGLPRRVLRGFDLQANPGQTVALVGASGCGKSTVLQLLQRFYDPDVGTLELDDKDIRTELALPRLRRQLGVVQQEPVLFERSVAENIAYGDNARRVSAHEVVAAAKAANIHAFIASLPQGYDTSLGAGGAALSGGQRQRVCIARALLRQPRLLLLDEATSALDAASEKAVAEALDKAAKGRTCITIAHRLSTIKNADVICVVDKGQIIEQGSHGELLERRGYYWKLSQGQQMA